MIQPPPRTTLPTLKKRAEFLAVAKGGRTSRRAFVMQAAASEDGPRVGYTVTKKTGNAVERNRIRRRFRAAVRAAAEQARGEVDYVLVGRRGALSAGFGDLVREIGQCLARAPLSGGDAARPRHRKRPAPGHPEQRPEQHRGGSDRRSETSSE